MAPKTILVKLNVNCKSQLSEGWCDTSSVTPIGRKPLAVAIWLNWGLIKIKLVLFETEK